MKKMFKNWTSVPNEIINNPLLSFRAKGLWSYLVSKPEGWKFSVTRIKAQTKEGKDAITTALRELEELGLLRRMKMKSEKGEFIGIDYCIFTKDYRSIDGKPANGESELGNPIGGKSVNISNTIESNTNNSNIEERKGKFKNLLHPFIEKYGKEMILDFGIYWSAKAPRGRKMKFEMRENSPFDIEARLRTWNRNETKWNKKESSAKEKVLPKAKNSW